MCPFEIVIVIVIVFCEVRADKGARQVSEREGEPQRASIARSVITTCKSDGKPWRSGARRNAK